MQQRWHRTHYPDSHRQWIAPLDFVPAHYLDRESRDAFKFALRRDLVCAGRGDTPADTSLLVANKKCDGWTRDFPPEGALTGFGAANIIVCTSILWRANRSNLPAADKSKLDGAKIYFCNRRGCFPPQDGRRTT